ncbi:type III PLP-dependent enzyme [Alsobacter metallidurans]|nr:type III PLP-dependent enzyme [Alsobacter metallidurans]
MAARKALVQVAKEFGTPAYVYDLDVVRARLADLARVFAPHFSVSYALKANPNPTLLASLAGQVALADASSVAEVHRSTEAGFPADRVTFSGPAKRPRELRDAISACIGGLVLESVREAAEANRIAAELHVRQDVILRINPATSPRHFGVSFSGKASQFGVDEEELSTAIERIQSLNNLKLTGFHIYSGTNSLNAQAVSDNFAIFIRIFRRACQLAELRPAKLIFGSGFGIPYLASEAELDIDAIGRLVIPSIAEMRSEPVFADTMFVLEMGRWIVGPAGWLLTSVVAEKLSRAVDFRMCDAGFNNHLAACGMMGTVIRRNWRIENVSNPDAAMHRYTLVGPLCTSIDVLASDIELPEVRVDDTLAIANSGAYGLTASPTRFISHPEPAEIVLIDGAARDATERGSPAEKPVVRDQHRGCR